jgi:hypothetical protein
VAVGKGYVLIDTSGDFGGGQGVQGGFELRRSVIRRNREGERGLKWGIGPRWGNGTES